MSARPALEPALEPAFDAARFVVDPYPAYRAWREGAPVHWNAAFAGGAWIVARHADVERVLRDPAFSARRTGGWVQRCAASSGELQGFQELFARALLFLDGADHARIRGVLQAAFRPPALNAVMPVVEGVLDELCEAVDGNEEFDFMQAIARPLPARVIGSMLGADDVAHDECETWCDDLAAFIGALDPTHEQAERAQHALLAIVRRLQPALRRRAVPAHGLLGCLLEAEAAGVVGARAELLAQAAMLLFAGYETTRNLLGNGLYALLAHRSQWQRLCQAPTLLPAAVRELLRFESPVQYTGRRVAADTTLHGATLRRGDLVLAMIGSANRDPQVYERADELDVARRGNAPLSFGAGPHACLGAALASLEAQAVLRRLLERWPDLTLSDEAPAWSGNAVYRGLSRLRVRARSSRVAPSRTPHIA